VGNWEIDLQCSCDTLLLFQAFGGLAEHMFTEPEDQMKAQKLIEQAEYLHRIARAELNRFRTVRQDPDYFTRFLLNAENEYYLNEASSASDLETYPWPLKSFSKVTFDNLMNAQAKLALDGARTLEAMNLYNEASNVYDGILSILPEPLDIVDEYPEIASIGMYIAMESYKCSAARARYFAEGEDNPAVAQSFYDEEVALLKKAMTVAQTMLENGLIDPKFYDEMEHELKMAYKLAYARANAKDEDGDESPSCNGGRHDVPYIG
jgi:hypothetical protein